MIGGTHLNLRAIYKYLCEHVINAFIWLNFNDPPVLKSMTKSVRDRLYINMWHNRFVKEGEIDAQKKIFRADSSINNIKFHRKYAQAFFFILNDYWKMFREQNFLFNSTDSIYTYDEYIEEYHDLIVEYYAKKQERNKISRMRGVGNNQQHQAIMQTVASKMINKFDSYINDEILQTDNAHYITLKQFASYIISEEPEWWHNDFTGSEQKFFGNLENAINKTKKICGYTGFIGHTTIKGVYVMDVIRGIRFTESKYFKSSQRYHKKGRKSGQSSDNNQQQQDVNSSQLQTPSNNNLNAQNQAYQMYLSQYYSQMSQYQNNNNNNFNDNNNNNNNFNSRKRRYVQLDSQNDMGQSNKRQKQ